MTRKPAQSLTGRPRVALAVLEGHAHSVRAELLESRRNVTADLDWDEFSGRGDPAQRFRLYRICPGETRPELVATCATAEAVGVALVTLGREGEWDECPVGVLDSEGEIGAKWIFRPWLPSPRNISDAGRVLGSARKKDQPAE